MIYFSINADIKSINPFQSLLSNLELKIFLPANFIK